MSILDDQRQSDLKVKPTIHFMRFIYAFSILFCFVAVVFAYSIVKMEETISSLISLSSLSNDVQNAINLNFIKLSVLAFSCYMVTGVFSLVYAFILSRKFSGPVNVIVQQIRQFKAKNFKVTRTLRKSDELHEILYELQELGKVLDQTNHN